MHRKQSSTSPGFSPEGKSSGERLGSLWRTPQRTPLTNAPTASTHERTRSGFHLQSGRSRTAECKLDTLALSASTSPVSRPLELSLQSALQLSLTVLVRYRFRSRI